MAATDFISATGWLLAADAGVGNGTIDVKIPVANLPSALDSEKGAWIEVAGVTYKTLNAVKPSVLSAEYYYVNIRLGRGITTAAVKGASVKWVPFLSLVSHPPDVTIDSGSSTVVDLNQYFTLIGDSKSPTYSVSPVGSGIQPYTTSINRNLLTINGTTGQWGTVGLSVVANDPNNKSDSISATFDVTVNEIDLRPQSLRALGHIETHAGVAPLQYDLTRYFSDPNGDAITFRVQGGTADVTATISGSTLIVTPLAGAVVTLLVSATSRGLTTSQQFQITVASDAPPRQEKTVPDVVLQGASNTSLLRLADYFVDPLTLRPWLTKANVGATPFSITDFFWRVVNVETVPVSGNPDTYYLTMDTQWPPVSVANRPVLTAGSEIHVDSRGLGTPSSLRPAITRLITAADASYTVSGGQARIRVQILGIPAANPGDAPLIPWPTAGYLPWKTSGVTDRRLVGYIGPAMPFTFTRIPGQATDFPSGWDWANASTQQARSARLNLISVDRTFTSNPGWQLLAGTRITRGIGDVHTVRATANSELFRGGILFRATIEAAGYRVRMLPGESIQVGWPQAGLTFEFEGRGTPGSVALLAGAIDPSRKFTTQQFQVTTNIAPTVANAIPDQALEVGADNILDISQVFDDIDTLTYAVTTSVDHMVKAVMVGEELHLHGLTTGSVTVDVVATDAYGLSATDSFVLTLTPSLAALRPDLLKSVLEDHYVDAVLTPSESVPFPQLGTEDWKLDAPANTGNTTIRLVLRPLYYRTDTASPMPIGERNIPRGAAFSLLSQGVSLPQKYVLSRDSLLARETVLPAGVQPRGGMAVTDEAFWVVEPTRLVGYSRTMPPAELYEIDLSAKVSQAQDIALSGDRFLVMDRTSGRLTVWMLTGDEIPAEEIAFSNYGVGFDTTLDEIFLIQGASVNKFDSAGALQAGQSWSFSALSTDPTGLAVTQTRVLIADGTNNRIRVFDHAGVHQPLEDIDVDFYPNGVAVDADGRVWTRKGARTMVWANFYAPFSTRANFTPALYGPLEAGDEIRFTRFAAGDSTFNVRVVPQTQDVGSRFHTDRDFEALAVLLHPDELPSGVEVNINSELELEGVTYIVTNATLLRQSGAALVYRLVLRTEADIIAQSVQFPTPQTAVDVVQQGAS